MIWCIIIIIIRCILHIKLDSSSCIKKKWINADARLVHVEKNMNKVDVEVIDVNARE